MKPKQTQQAPRPNGDQSAVDMKHRIASENYQANQKKKPRKSGLDSGPASY